MSVTHDFKFQAPDGKQRAADALDAECVQTVAIRVVTEVDDVNESNFDEVKVTKKSLKFKV